MSTGTEVHFSPPALPKFRGQRLIGDDGRRPSARLCGAPQRGSGKKSRFTSSPPSCRTPDLKGRIGTLELVQCRGESRSPVTLVERPHLFPHLLWSPLVRNRGTKERGTEETLWVQSQIKEDLSKRTLDFDGTLHRRTSRLDLCRSRRGEHGDGRETRSTRNRHFTHTVTVNETDGTSRS